MTEIRTAPSRGLALGAAIALVTAGLLGTAYLARPTVAKADSHSQMPTSRELESKTGIRILSAHVEGDGGLIDVRYQVLDAQQGERRRGRCEQHAGTRAVGRRGHPHQDGCHAQGSRAA